MNTEALLRTAGAGILLTGSLALFACSGGWNGPRPPVEARPAARDHGAGLRGLPLQRQWTFHHSAYLGAHPVAVGAYLGVVDHKGRVLFLDPNAGEIRAETKAKGALDAPPVWDRERFYVTSAHPRRRLNAFSFKGGQRLWRREFTRPPESPILVKEEVWLPVGDTVYRLEGSGGEVLGTIAAGGEDWLTPVPLGDQFVLLGGQGTLRWLDGNGELRSERNVGRRCRGVLPLSDTHILIQTADGGVMQLTGTGAEVWQREIDSEGVYVVADGGTVFVAGVSGRVTALAQEDGEPLWDRRLQAPIPGPPVAVAGWLGVTTVDGMLHLLDRSSGDVLDTLSFGAIIQDPPSWAFGRLYVVTADKTIHAFAPGP